MTQFPRAKTLPKGENPNNFRSVGGDQYSNRDPTQSPPKDEGMFGSYGRDRDGERWGQLDRGKVDRQGQIHDW